MSIAGLHSAGRRLRCCFFPGFSKSKPHAYRDTSLPTFIFVQEARERPVRFDSRCSPGWPIACWVKEVPLIITGAEHVKGIDLGVAGGVARLADGVAEVEYVGFEQRPVGTRQDRCLEPLPVDSIVGPEDGDLIGPVCTVVEPQRDALRIRGIVCARLSGG